MTALVDELMWVFAGPQGPVEGDEVHESMRRNLADLGPEEALRQAEEARKRVWRFMDDAEYTNLVLFLALERALITATEARDRARWALQDASER